MEQLDVAVAAAERVVDAVRSSESQVTVVVSLYNYEDLVVNALESVFRQDIEQLDLIVVDDRSSDHGARVVEEWMNARAPRFGRCMLICHAVNHGLATARNQGFAAAATPFVFVLDADNELYPRCLSACMSTAIATEADAVYTLLEVFGDVEGVMGTDLWNVERLRAANYIDAMALVRRAAWARVGGYRRMPVTGWEDYDFWLKFAEAGLELVRVPEILCRYRHHPASMLRTVTNSGATLKELHEDMYRHHPGVRIS